MTDFKNETHKLALKWLLEMGVVTDPIVQNEIQIRILGNFPGVKSFELLVLREPRSEMLVMLHGSFITRKFRKQKTIEGVELLLKSMLPTYKIRVIMDQVLWEKAQQNVKDFLSDESK